MNGDIFMKWCENRLFPTFQRLFPSKQLILILDNASYHHVRGPDYINPNQMNKEELATQLISFGYNEITVQRTTGRGCETVPKKFTATSFFRPRSKKYAPTADELRHELKQYLKAHPDKNPTQMQKLFHKHNYILIYTPPYTPAVQPIEMVWSNVKGYIGRQYKIGRTMNELKQQTMDGFYGNVNHSYKGITADLCQSLINNCHTWCNQFIADDDVLVGEVNALQLDDHIDDTNIDIDDDIDKDMEPLQGESIEEEASDEE
jgi:transposase